VRLGRIEELGVWMALRRACVALAVGTLILIVAGTPEPSGVLGWFGLVLLLFAVFLVGAGWFQYARGVPLRETMYGHQMLATAAGLVGLALVLLTGWTVAIGLGAHTLSPLSLVLVTSVAAGLIVVFALWRRTHTGR
jgi:hypothetical protein